MSQSNVSGPLNVSDALIVGGTANIAGALTASGGLTLSGGSLSYTGGTIATGALTASGTVGGTAVTFNGGTFASGAGTITGLLNAGNVHSGGTINATGLLSGANISTAGTIGAGNITSTGEIKGATGQFGGTANYIGIDSAGMLTMYGTATVWDDLRVSSATARQGATPPGFDVWKGGIRLHAFDATQEESVHFEVQMAHSWKTGSTLYPHVHWVPKSNGSAGQLVTWGLEYTWQNIGGTYAALGTVFGNTHSPADASLVADKHYLTELGTAGIDGTGKTLSSMLMCRLFRDATGSLGTDDYAADALLLEFDVHYEMDTLGSNQELVK